MRRLAVLVATFVLVGTAGCSGSHTSRGEAPKVSYRGDSGPNKVPDEGPWKEAEVPLPPYPREQDLIRFEPRGQTTNRFYVDGSSLTVETDKVIRFALVIRTAEGASTASYAGMNCKTGEWKEYAYGRAEEQRWKPARDAPWRPIQDQRINNYQYTLAVDFFCRSGLLGAPAGSPKLIVRHLKNPPPKDYRAPSPYN